MIISPYLAIILEKTDKDGELNKEIIAAYERAGEIALTTCIEDEKQGTIKRNASTSTNGSLSISKLMELCLLRPGHLLIENGLVLKMFSILYQLLFIS